MSRTAELAQTLIYAIRRHHEPIPEGSGGTGDTPDLFWNGPCRACLEVWPCYASQAADMLERLLPVAEIARREADFVGEDDLNRALADLDVVGRTA